MLIVDVHNYADIAAIVGTVIVVISAGIGVRSYLKSRAESQKKCQRLEDFLHSEKDKKINKGQRTIPRIMAETGLSEKEIFKASTVNPHIKRRVRPDPVTRKGTEILYEYLENPNDTEG